MKMQLENDAQTGHVLAEPSGEMDAGAFVWPEGLAERAEEILRKRFGLTSFRAGQKAIVGRLLAGRSAAAIFPTGGGKSLCYQLPALMIDGLTLVVSPLMALMREQSVELQARGIPAARLDSSLTSSEAGEVYRGVRDGAIKILYVAPERFFNERFRAFLADQTIGMLAIDEAHCISQWGHNFRPDYLKLARAAREFKAQRILALTATATPDVMTDIQQGFGIAAEDVIQTPFYRSNLVLSQRGCTVATREQRLREVLAETRGTKRLVYVTLQKTAELVAQALSSEGLPVRAYHAGMPDDQRRDIQDWFQSHDDAVVVATIAFGMGIDVPDIRAIVHYNPPNSIESYAQEIGRAGRDGQSSHCEVLVVPQDRVVIDNFVYGDTPALSSMKQLCQFLQNQPPEFYVSLSRLSRRTDIRMTVLRILLTHLELEDYLESVAPRYDEYKFKPLVSSAEILGHFSGERQQFARRVLTMAKRKAVWCYLDIESVVKRLSVDRSRVIRMLDYFAEQGWLELRAAGLVHGYRRKKPIEDAEALAQRMFEQAVEREATGIRRVDQLYGLFCSNECQSRQLSEYFGQPFSGACGHCQACDGSTIDESHLAGADSSVDAKLIEQVCAKALRHPDALKEPRQCARFLAGINSPALVAAKLTRDPLFGKCAEVPFAAIMTSFEQSMQGA